jgi:NAD(P)-dependent dehydrogenase (short-subunit alcohol dehydrogenase family)
MSILDTLHPPPDLRVLVTGGANGVGAAIARAFHEAGARVHVCDIDRSALDRLHAESPGITGSMADASVEADVDMVFDDLRGALGGLDVLVSNAGISGPIGAIQDVDRRAWERTVAVNLNSQYYFAHRAVPLLRRSPSGASLIAIGARTASAAHGFRSAGVATRWAVLGLVRSLASELGADGIRVNAILAGAPRRASSQGAPAADVAGLALFLCSPAARHLTGQIIGVGAHAEGGLE